MKKSEFWIAVEQTKSGGWSILLKYMPQGANKAAEFLLDEWVPKGHDGAVKEALSYAKLLGGIKAVVK